MSPFVFWPVGILVGKLFAAVGGLSPYINRLFSRPLRHFAPLSRYFNDCRFSINIRIMGRPNLSLLGEDTIFSVAMLAVLAR